MIPFFLWPRSARCGWTVPQTRRVLRVRRSEFRRLYLEPLEDRTLLSFSATVVIPTGSGAGSVAVADLNHDGHLDVVVANLYDNTVSVLLGDGHGTFSPASGTPLMAGSSPAWVTVGDCNGDGNPDLVVANSDD